MCLYVMYICVCRNIVVLLYVCGEECSLLCVCCVQLRQWLQEACSLIQAEENVQSNIRTQLTEMRVSRAMYTAHVHCTCTG